uniref:Uncharacterized protein n=1 Tax=Hyaloperonospora arabidopsidis (strain Emoy2) TaxID=559515 RepID=M4BJJ3_HYAAE
MIISSPLVVQLTILNRLLLLLWSPRLVSMLTLMLLHTPMKTLLILSILSLPLHHGVVRTLPSRTIQKSRERAVRTVQQYAVRQGFAVSTVCTRSRRVKRVLLCCLQDKDY